MSERNRCCIRFRDKNEAVTLPDRTQAAPRPESNQPPHTHTMTSPDTDRPDGVSDEVIVALEDCSDTQLREIIHYAQQLLREHPSLTDAIESRGDEELVYTEDHGAYTIAVVERPNETGWARGPFVYRVNWEPARDGWDGQYRWHYLGKVQAESDGDRR